MDWRILFSTFTLIFLAELGDKTQLAALAATAGTKSTWSVFTGASLALVLSTLVAVLIGHALQRVVPPQAIKLTAGALFILFGVLLLHSAFTTPQEAEERPTASATGHGLLSRIILESVLPFEEATLNEYRHLAQSAEGTAREALQFLIREEQRHLSHLQAMLQQSGDQLKSEPFSPGALPIPEFNLDAPAREIFCHAAEQEQQAAAFFQGLAERALSPSLRVTFQALANDEAEHARILSTFQNS